MRRKKIDFQIEKKRLIMAGIICLSFLCAVLIGAIISNCMKSEQVSLLGGELQAFFSQISENGMGEKPKFTGVFLKYFKYIFLIWFGGWIPFGIFLSGGILMFRGVSLGFTTAMLMKEFGLKGMVAAIFAILPQNFLLIPVYLAITWIAISFSLERGVKYIGKAGLKRERNRRATEYSILFCIAIVCVALASLVEVWILPHFMKVAASILN